MREGSSLEGLTYSVAILLLHKILRGDQNCGTGAAQCAMLQHTTAGTPDNVCHSFLRAESLPLFESCKACWKGVTTKLHIDFQTNQPSYSICYYEEEGL